MNLGTVNKAAEEARRFLKAAEALNKAEAEKAAEWHSCPRESGACRRASMDLTRALAELRKPG